ncbi:hemin receptor [Xanthobacter dioxanivorans]|uniref:Hemin receptor n=2 Tax=Xanthobacter dioxanivorans TaxID=2528964 RepID=A0A974SLD4_9HYPH|nr:hemin receptor [Xanthobacter dioxanivorans]
MHNDQILLLETSFAEVHSVGEAAAALFYERLFVHDPSLRRLFGDTDMTQQGQKLFAALRLVVNSLRNLPAVVPVLEDLAVRHTAYGVRNTHYDTVGVALIETLSLYFGARFTPELRAAWTDAYGTVASVMTGAADRAAEHQRAVAV